MTKTKNEVIFVAEILYKFAEEKVFIMSVKCLNHQRKKNNIHAHVNYKKGNILV